MRNLVNTQEGKCIAAHNASDLTLIGCVPALPEMLPALIAPELQADDVLFFDVVLSGAQP
jgi:hypothetical protein